MLRQVFSSPAVRSSARLAARPARLSRPQPFQTAPLISARTIQPSISRWYSSETGPASKEAAKENGESKQPADSQANGKEAEGEEALKKQLEAKEAEAKDWKVCISASHAFVLRPISRTNAHNSSLGAGQIHAIRRRFSEPPRPDPARHEGGKRLCHSELR